MDLPETFATPAARARIALIAESFARLLGRPLVRGADPVSALWQAPFAVVAHGTEADPIFRYANTAALTLWEMDWNRFTRLPSRLSAEAEPDIQGDRARLLAAALARGWVGDYAGIRISASGRRFRIADTILWTVTDATGQRHGQAALIGRVERLD